MFLNVVKYINRVPFKDSIMEDFFELMDWVVGVVMFSLEEKIMGTWVEIPVMFVMSMLVMGFKKLMIKGGQ